MAKSCDTSLRCNCDGVIFKYLEKNVITKKLLKSLCDQMKDTRVACSPVSIMYTGGTIRPIKEGQADEVVQAIGFHAGLVVAAGSRCAVEAEMKRVSKSYDVVPLPKEHTLVPGLIEPHLHTQKEP